MQEQHTPGPWTLSKWAFNPGKGLPAHVYAGEEGLDEIAICEFDREPDDIEAAWANARLIAKAPDLLARCRELIDAMERYEMSVDNSPTQEHRELMLRARKTVQEATKMEG